MVLRSALLTLAWFVCTVCPLWAQSAGAPLQWQVGADLGAAQDIQGTEASVNRQAYHIRTQWRDWTLSYRLDQFDWDSARDLGWDTATPWESLHQVGAHWRRQGTFTQHWGWFTRLGGRATFEQEPGRSFQADAGGAVSYHPCPDWRLALGAGLTAHHLRTRVLPVASLAWRGQASSGWSVRLGVPETRLRHSWDNGIWAGVELQNHNRLARLADDSPVVSAGYLEIEDWSVGPVLGWENSGSWRLEFTPRYHFNREYTIFDPHGDKKDTWDIDNGWSLQFGLRYTLSVNP